MSTDAQGSRYLQLTEMVEKAKVAQWDPVVVKREIALPPPT